jgi:hypothetical protein
MLPNSDVEADVALGHCASSGPRSLTPGVMQTFGARQLHQPRMGEPRSFGGTSSQREAVAVHQRTGPSERAGRDAFCDRHSDLVISLECATTGSRSGGERRERPESLRC